MEMIIVELLEMVRRSSLLKSQMYLQQLVTDAAKILWTTTLTTPYVVTTESTWQLNMRTTDSVSIDFDR